MTEEASNANRGETWEAKGLSHVDAGDYEITVKAKGLINTEELIAFRDRIIADHEALVTERATIEAYERADHEQARLAERYAEALREIASNAGHFSDTYCEGLFEIAHEALSIPGQQDTTEGSR